MSLFNTTFYHTTVETMADPVVVVRMLEPSVVVTFAIQIL